MKVTCDFCEATGHGTIDKLVDEGWQKAVIDVTIGNKRTKKTVIACQEHRNEFHKAVMVAFRPEQHKRKRTEKRKGD